MTVKTEAMLEVASTFIATESENRATKMIMMIAVTTQFSGHSPSCVRSPSGRDNKFKAESNCALEHSRKIADVKASWIETRHSSRQYHLRSLESNQSHCNTEVQIRTHTHFPLAASIEFVLQGRRATEMEPTLSSTSRTILLCAKLMVNRIC